MKRQTTPTVHCKFSEMVKPEKLKPHPRNANKHPDDQIERLGKIIQEHGWRHPIVVSEDSGFIVFGHARVVCALKNKWDKVPVQYQKFESEEAEFQSLIADNEIARWASVDLSAIHNSLKDLAPFDIELMGFKDFKFEPDPVEVAPKKMTLIECPKCGEEFEKSQASSKTI